ncbi:hypothetical protein QBC34DRAFT_306133 [Podospora aff. communis PSN243]|uniref:Small ribosomal subunit protein mS37 n=1 Tax=Podospora aff. communis PSN243 TaxID=3040156 RepID=A0AAV9GBL9_9PEZI|nr:hypothetical protein QBC34DRAFT_306133 [Podospora aff. communis PSN243]
MSSRKAMRLPPLEVLRVKKPNKIEPNPCHLVMNHVLACWASAGFNTAGCANVEAALRACMDKPPAPPTPKNNINYHLNRLSSRLTQKASRHT